MASDNKVSLDMARHALMGVCRALETDENSITAVQRLVDKAKGIPQLLQVPSLATELGITVAPSLVACFVSEYLARWDDGGADALSIASVLSRDEVSGDADPVEGAMLLLGAVQTLARRALGEDYDDDDDLAEGLVALLILRLPTDVAIEVATAAVDLARSPTVALSAADGLIAVANDEHRESLAAGWAARGWALAALAETRLTDSRHWLSTYDAIERACRVAPPQTGSGWRHQMLELTVTHPQLRGLVGLTGLVARGANELPEDLRGIELYLQPVWITGRPDPEELRAICELAIAVEDGRLALEAGSTTQAAHADWNRWAIDHRAYRQALPLGDSVLHESSCDLILRTLNHEVTHLYTGYGHLGSKLMALRFAAWGTELRIWHQVQDGPESTDQVLTQVWAELGVHEPLSLALVEAQLQQYRRAQLLRATWLPWLEGVAVFSELSADPAASPESLTHAHAILRNIVDQMYTTPEALQELWSRADERYAAALRRQALPSLRTYLGESYGDRYLPGYLAVRACITSWRRRHGLNGVDAAMALYAVTVAGTADACPDLDLPTAEFGRQARARMVEWVQQMSLLDAESLEVLVSLQPARWHIDPSTPAGWRVAPRAPGELDESDAAGYEAQLAADVAAACHWPLDNPDPEQELDDLAARVVQATHSALASKPWMYDDVTQAAGQGLSSQQRLISLGRVMAPFWVDPVSSVVRVLIRITENDAVTGEPDYKLSELSLPPDRLDLLLREINTRNEARMLVERLTDALPYNDEQRGFGRHVLALAYGDFCLVVHLGGLTGTTVSPGLEDDVRSKLVPEPFVAAESKAADGTGAAMRALRWLNGPVFWQTGDVSLPMEAWADRVRRLAEQVAANDDQRLVTESGLALLTSLGLPRERAERAVRVGVQAFHDDPFADVSSTLNLILTTAWTPEAGEVPGVGRDVLAQLFEPTPEGWDMHGWKEE